MIPEAVMEDRLWQANLRGLFFSYMYLKCGGRTAGLGSVCCCHEEKQILLKE